MARKIITTTLLCSVAILLLSACTLGTGKRVPLDGGFYISVNAGETWESRSLVAQLERSTVTLSPYDASYMVFHPKDALAFYFISRANGVYKTTNGGLNWEATPLTNGLYTAFVIDSQNTDTLYAAQGTTIIKSGDAGNTWTPIYIETRPSQTITSFVIDPANSEILYASTQKSVIKSNDAGTTWQPLTWAGTNAQRLLMSKRNPDTLFLYDANYGFYSSADGGTTWIDHSASLSSYPGSNVVNWIDFDPLSDRLTIATNYGVLVSTDAAQSWTPLGSLIPFGSVPIKTAAINPTNTNEIYFTVGNVIYKTVDGGQTWKTLQTVPTSRSIGSLYISKFNSSVLFAGTAL